MANVDFNGLPIQQSSEDDVLALQVVAGLMYQTTVSGLLTTLRALGEAHSNTDFTHEPITTTPMPLQGYDSSLLALGMTVTLTPTTGVSPSGFSNTANFTVNPNKGGAYRVTFNVDVESIGTTENADFVLYHTPISTGIAVETDFKASVDMRNNNIDRGTASINTFIQLEDNDKVEIYVNSDGATFSDLLIDSLTFTAKRA